MSLDYPDWSFPNWLLDQSAELYVADVFAKMLVNAEVTDRKLLKEGAILYCWDSIKVKDDGALMNMGTLRVLGE